MSFYVELRGAPEVEAWFESFPRAAPVAMSRAINDTARGLALDMAREQMLKEIAFPAGYLDQESRLGITQFATPTQLRAVITGRDRPTSLVRFIAGEAVKGQAVHLVVGQGQGTAIPGAFVVNLKSGNVGLAIRLRPGEMLHNRKDGVGVRFNADATHPNFDIALLYGPSVDQVFVGVSSDIEGPVEDEIGLQFTRQMGVLLNGDASNG